MGDESLSFPDDVLDQHIVTLFERLEGLRRSQTNKEARPLMQLEIRSLEFWRAIFAECVGSFFYVFIVCGAAAGAGLGASTSAVLLASALASGLAMGMLTHSLSHIS
ncbi:neurogenic protein big brain-like, partial [Ctenocephalides felis]